MKRALAAGLTVALAAVGVVAIAPASAEAAAGSTTILRQTAVLSWYSKHSTSASSSYGTSDVPVAIPGIGKVTLICRPDDTMILLKPSDTGTDSTPSAAARAKWADTDMQITKYEHKVNSDGKAYVSVAPKRVRIYPYDTAETTSTPGHTGISANEGFNQQNITIEDSSSGSMDGVISQIPNRMTTTLTGSKGVYSQKATPAPTEFHLTWAWTGFHAGGILPRCNVTATFYTHVQNVAAAKKSAATIDTSRVVTILGTKKRVGTTMSTPKIATTTLKLNLHGVNDDFAKLEESTGSVAGVGTFHLTSRPAKDPDDSSDDYGAWLTLTGAPAGTTITVKSTDREGDVTDPGNQYTTTYDAGDTIPIVKSGSDELVVKVGGTTKLTGYVSSYWDLHHFDNPHTPIVDSNGNVTGYYADLAKYNLTEVNVGFD